MCALNRKQENQLIKYVNNNFIVGLGMLSRLIYNQIISELCRLYYIPNRICDADSNFHHRLELC